VVVLGFTGPAGAERDYEVDELLELSGGQGFVFRARLRTDRLGPGMAGTEISLKQLIDGAVGVDRVHELDDLIRPRTHPRLSRQLEVFRGPPITIEDAESTTEDESLTYVAAVWVDGQTVDRAAAGQPMEVVLRWVQQVGDALDFLHADCHRDGPVLHRDVKPHNVIVDTAGDAVLIDPGLASAVVAGVTGTPHGSPGYIPPEAQGGLRPSTAAGDRWQLAALTFALVTGDPPGRLPIDDARAALTKALRATHRPARLVDHIARMLAPEPGARPVRAADWAGDLRLIEAATRRLPTRARAQRALAAAGAAATIVGAGAVGFLASPGARPSAHAAPTPEDVFLPTDSRVPARLGLGRVVVVDNRVTDGPNAMRQDVPAYLSTIPEDYCKESGCALPSTEMTSGTMLTAVCQTIAEQTTNGDDQALRPGTNVPVDAANPGRYSSDRWYGITLRDGRHGYIWEGWLTPDDRGGLGLPQC
jgi:hypothetical protein